MPRMSRSVRDRPAAEAAGGELAVEVPQRESVRHDVEVGVAALAVLQRVDVGHQVAAHAVGVDQLLDPGALVDVVLVRGGDVLDPAHRLVRDPQRREDLVVEVVLAEQQLVDAAQEVAGLRALDDPVVVRRGQRQDLGDRVARQRLLRGALPLGRVFDRPDPDDGALALHQSRDRVDGADRARVGEADGGAGEVVDHELAGPRPADDVLVGRPELREVHGVRALDGRHEELAGAVGLGQVDGQAEVDVLGLDQGGLAVDLGEGGVHLGQRGHRPDDGPPEDVREGHLAAARAGQVVVDDDPVVDEQLGRHRTH